jgi:hypothetical protein
LKKSNRFNVRPRPGPLSRGEGEAGNVAGKFVRRICDHRLLAVRFKPNTTTSGALIAINRGIILPLPGERAGARADVTTNFSESRVTFHVSRN